MAFGKRIRLFRTRKGLLQKQLGELLGFKGKTSEVRIAQYENEARAPKADLVKQMASIFDVDPRAITVPEIDTPVGLAHTLFALEDMYGLTITMVDGTPYIGAYAFHKEFPYTLRLLRTWAEMKQKKKSGEITQEDYDNWRYHYPENTPGFVKVPPQIFTQGEMDELSGRKKK